MESHQESLLSRFQTKRRKERYTLHDRRGFYAIEARAARDMNSSWILAELAHATTRHLGGNKMEVCHLSNGVPKSVVHCPFRDIPSSDMRNWNPSKRRRCNDAQYLIPVAENQEQVRPEASERLATTIHNASQRGRDIPRRITSQVHSDGIVNGETIRENVVRRSPRCHDQVLSGYDHLQIKRRFGAQRD